MSFYNFMLNSKWGVFVGKVIERTAAANLVKNLQKEGKTVVTTNGCFDILHVGHVRYLSQTKSFGDCLVVLLNSDKSVRAIKAKVDQ